MVQKLLPEGTCASVGIEEQDYRAKLPFSWSLLTVSATKQGRHKQYIHD